ncbi:hypothetical protein D4764_12G0004400, partial [Takifugu flavidus]
QFNKDCRLTAKGGETRPHLSRCMLGKAAFLCIIKGRQRSAEVERRRPGLSVRRVFLTVTDQPVEAQIISRGKNMSPATEHMAPRPQRRNTLYTGEICRAAPLGRFPLLISSAGICLSSEQPSCKSSSLGGVVAGAFPQPFERETTAL